MGKERDEQCAAALGLTRDKWRSECYVYKHSFDGYDYDPTDNTESGWCYICGASVADRVADGHVAPPRCSEDHVAARLLEDEIERRGLHYEYVKALCFILGDISLRELEARDVWALLRAAPEQRAKAFLQAIADA